ncbi:unnamed protein product [Symbiodinium sp. CCMP2592]|nr:unnamed protein product [Symbiodinium sp. CCMP2592]
MSVKGQPRDVEDIVRLEAFADVSALVRKTHKERTLLETFEKYVIEHLREGAVKTLAGEGPAEGFQRAKPSGGGFPPKMEWHWASDGSAREIFGPAVDVLLKYLPNFQLLAAKFIVATGECSAEDAKFHQDFEPPTVPLLATATALAPVWPLAFPEKEGNLEFFTWDDMIKSKQQGSPDEVMKLRNVHRYTPGEVAIFDGKLFHRTQPFSEHAFASSSLHGESEVLSKRRILASFYFAQLPEGNTWEGPAAVLLV